MNPIQGLIRWLDRKGEESYRSSPDTYIREVIEPRKAELARREERLGESFVTDYMRGHPPKRGDDQ